MIYDIKLFLWRIIYALYIMHYNKNLLEINIKACPERYISRKIRYNKIKFDNKTGDGYIPVFFLHIFNTERDMT